MIPSHVHPPGRLSDSGHTGPPLTSHPELRLKRGQEGKALQLPAWTPVPPLSGLSLSPGPHPEQTLRGGQQTLIPCISKEISITISLSTTPGGQPPGSQDTRRRGSDPHPPPPTSASTKFPRGLSTPTSTRLLGSSLTSQEFRSRAGHTELCAVWGPRGWEEAVRQACLQIQALPLLNVWPWLHSLSSRSFDFPCSVNQ